jgi:phosphoenolpyruvate-protein kinase (PTS system EI component)
MATPAESEATFTGRSIAPGLAMGPAWIVADPLQLEGPATSIGKEAVEQELLRLKHSFDESLAELDHYAQRIEREFDAALAGIFRAHGEMLRSLVFFRRTRARIA